jgi:hypothetical protein
MPPEVRALLASTTPAVTSPPDVPRPHEAAIEDGVDLTTPGGDAGSGSGSASPAPSAKPVQEPVSLTIKDSGAIEGSYGISKYWPVTKYWGADKTLGKFDEPVAGNAGWRMIGHKFQTVGEFKASTTTSGAGGGVTFLQEARITATKGGTAGAWFNDMDYTDSGGGVHAWDPNAEAGTNGAGGHKGVRRTVSTTKYAYTDPPALSYKTGETNTYRKLEFKIHLKPPPGASQPEIVKTATQEIEVKDGVPKVLQAP